MTDQQNPDRPQTLLEAAKALVALKGWTEQFNEMRHLCAAIAREEADCEGMARRDLLRIIRTKVGGRSGQSLTEAVQAVVDRAQQAESTAAWHKAESGRLSAELALARNQLTLAVERSERLSGQLAGCHYDLGEANKQRRRAEKAEAEAALAKAKSHPMDGGDITVMLNRAGVKSWRDAFVNMTTPERVEWLIGDWRKAEAEAARWKARADDAETAVASHCGQLPAFEGDPKACAFHEPRDPLTGWTFDTYRKMVQCLFREVPK